MSSHSPVRLHRVPDFAFLAYGVRVGVRISRPSLLRRLDEVLPPGARPITGRVDCLYDWCVSTGAAPHTLRLDNQVVVQAVDLDTLLLRFASNVELTIAERAPRRIFIHAGVVSWRGRAIVLPGRSYAGKSRLVAALLREGATYYSDEFAVLDARGRVHAYPRQLSLRISAENRPRKRDALPLAA